VGGKRPRNRNALRDLREKAVPSFDQKKGEILG